MVEIRELSFVRGLVDEFADQVDRTKLGIGHVEAGGVGEEVEHGTLFDAPADGRSDRLQKLIELPLVGAKRRDIADGTHRNFDQARRVDEGLSGLLLRDNSNQAPDDDISEHDQDNTHDMVNDVHLARDLDAPH